MKKALIAMVMAIMAVGYLCARAERQRLPVTALITFTENSSTNLRLR